MFLKSCLLACLFVACLGSTCNPGSSDEHFPPTPPAGPGITEQQNDHHPGPPGGGSGGGSNPGQNPQKTFTEFEILDALNAAKTLVELDLAVQRLNSETCSDCSASTVPFFINVAKMYRQRIIAGNLEKRVLSVKSLDELSVLQDEIDRTDLTRLEQNERDSLRDLLDKIKKNKKLTAEFDFKKNIKEAGSSQEFQHVRQQINVSLLDSALKQELIKNVEDKWLEKFNASAPRLPQANFSGTWECHQPKIKEYFSKLKESVEILSKFGPVPHDLQKHLDAIKKHQDPSCESEIDAVHQLVLELKP